MLQRVMAARSLSCSFNLVNNSNIAAEKLLAPVSNSRIMLQRRVYVVYCFGWFVALAGD